MSLLTPARLPTVRIPTRDSRSADLQFPALPPLVPLVDSSAFYRCVHLRSLWDLASLVSPCPSKWSHGRSALSSVARVCLFLPLNVRGHHRRSGGSVSLMSYHSLPSNGSELVFILRTTDTRPARTGNVSRLPPMSVYRHALNGPYMLYPYRA